MSGHDLRFGRFSLDGERKVLLDEGKPLALGARGVALLAALLRAGGRPVSKAALMDEAWPGQSVEESNLSVQIAALRKVLGTNAKGEDWIATVPRVGYRFMDDSGQQHEPGAERTVHKPSIAVLPFVNQSSDLERAFFADGMTEDIITALSRIGELSVMSRGSSFALKGQAITPQAALTTLGVDFVLEGSVRPSANRLRVTAHLTDCRSAHTVWSDRYDGESQDVFDVQDNITRSIAQAMHITLTKGEAGRLWEGQSKNLRAWEKAILGSQVFHRYSKADSDLARKLLEEAATIDPDFLGARAFLGIIHYWDARYVMSIDRRTAIGHAQKIADELEAIDPSLSQLLTLKSCLAFLRGQHDEAVTLGKSAASRSPGDTRSLGFLGMFQIYAGQLEDALASFKLAIRSCPIREPYLYYYPAILHMWLGQLDKALDLAIENSQVEVDEPYSLAYLAAVHVFRGESSKAQQVIHRLRDGAPEFSIANLRYSELYRDQNILVRLTAALKDAGLPD